MRCKPFESAASELVPESEHPLEQLRLLDEKAQELSRKADWDAVIECRIKQLSLQKVLVHLYDFPLKDLVQAQCALAEAYGSGAYHAQAQEHLAKAREACGGGVHDDVQSQRLEVDLLMAEGAIHFARENLDQAERALTSAVRLARGVFSSRTLRSARAHDLLGQIAQRRKRPADVVDHLRTAAELHESIDGPEAEQTLRLNLRLAEALYADGDHYDAIEEQKKVAEALRQSGALPELLVSSLSQLARWLESQGRDYDSDALDALQEAERVVEEHVGKEDPKAVEIKRDVALLQLKLGNHDIALQYLQNVEYLERRLHGSQSTNVARILKALGTVHMVRQNVGEAEQCLVQALRIFEADYPPNTAIIRDIKAKLNSIASAAKG